MKFAGVSRTVGDARPYKRGVEDVAPYKINIKNLHKINVFF